MNIVLSKQCKKCRVRPCGISNHFLRRYNTYREFCSIDKVQTPGSFCRISSTGKEKNWCRASCQSRSCKHSYLRNVQMTFDTFCCADFDELFQITNSTEHVKFSSATRYLWREFASEGCSSRAFLIPILQFVPHKNSRQVKRMLRGCQVKITSEHVTSRWILSGLLPSSKQHNVNRSLALRFNIFWRPRTCR